MVRAERMTREADIRHELETYNELLGGEGRARRVAPHRAPGPGRARPRSCASGSRCRGTSTLKLEGGEKVRARFDARQVGDDRLSSVQYLKFDVGGEVPVAAGSDLPGAHRRGAAHRRAARGAAGGIRRDSGG